jgi:hypothetical protein
MNYIDNLNNPLVITYCNKFKSTNFENTRRFVETLKNNNWEYLILGEGEEWKGFITKIIAVKKYLENINPDKIVVISDAHDVYCIKNSNLFINDFKKLNKSIIVSMELFAEGSINYNNNKDYYQVTLLTTYFKNNNININNINKKYVNGGLICGYANELLIFYNWMLENNYTDDQKAIGSYMNTYSDKVYADISNELLHTTTCFVNGGLHNNSQVVDSPSISELVGQQSYFLHIPGINGSKGQNFLYESIYKILQVINFNELQKIYPNYNFINYKDYYESKENNL